MDTHTKTAELSPADHRLLEQGVLSMSPWTNCAPGAWGYLVLDLKRRGLLQSRIVKTGPLPDEYVEHYWPTRRGRDAYVSYGPPFVPLSPTPSPSDTNQQPSP